jgi:hypothetical protein
MPQFILILVLAFSGSLANSSDTTVVLEDLPRIEFSNPALAFESGQPVFSKETSAILKIKTATEVKLIINDLVETQVSANEIDLSSLIDFKEGTYTVLIQGQGYDEAFGFTIK